MDVQQFKANPYYRSTRDLQSDSLTIDIAFISCTGLITFFHRCFTVDQKITNVLISRLHTLPLFSILQYTVLFTVSFRDTAIQKTITLIWCGSDTDYLETVNRCDNHIMITKKKKPGNLVTVNLCPLLLL